MNMDLRAILAIVFKRFLPALVAMALGIGVLLGAGSVLQMLLGFLFFLVAAIFVAGPIAQWLAEPMGSLFWPRKYYAKPQPMYGIPQSRRAKGQLEEALAEYEKIAAAHPDKNIDTGFKVFKLAESHFKQWQSDVASDGLEAQMKMFIDPVAENALPENMAYELLLRLGLTTVCSTTLAAT